MNAASEYTFTVYNLSTTENTLSWHWHSGISSHSEGVTSALKYALDCWRLAPGSYNVAVTQGDLLRLFTVTIPKSDPIISDLISL